MDYGSLKIQGRQIRLITIKPLGPNEPESAPVHCTIETATLPPEPEDWDLSLLPANYVSFDDEVTNAPDEPYGGSFRRDVALIEGTFTEESTPGYDDETEGAKSLDENNDGMPTPEYEIILPLNDILGMISFEDQLIMVRNGELNDRMRLTRPLDDIINFEGKLDTKDLNPFFRPPQPRSRRRPMDPQTYVAMSYSWGPEQPTASIFLNGIEIKARANLEEGLRRFRTMDYFKRGGKIWIDALCINQADDAEKSSQIPLMGSIYKLAGNVIVWLGPEADESSKAIDELQMLGALYRTEYIEAFDSSDPFTATAWRQMAQVRLRSSFFKLKNMYAQLGYDTSDEYFRLYKFFDRPYWRRLWIIQELCMGRAGMPVVCGPRVTQWRYIRDGIFIHTAFLDALQEELPEIVSRFTQEPMKNEFSMLHVAQIAQLEIYGHRKRLPEIDTSWLPVSSTFGYGHGPLHGSAVRRALILASQAQCFHLHDCVYGLLSLPGIPDLGITVDYSKHITTVLTEFALACITKGKSLELFSLIDGIGMPLMGFQRGGHALNPLPSWVPYLSRTPEQRVGVIEGDWHASGNKQGFVFEGYDLQPKLRESNVLICYGFIAEIVDGVGAISRADIDTRINYAPGFQTGVVQPTGGYTSSSEHGPEADLDYEDDESPRCRAARVAADDPRVYWVLTCGADVQGTKQSFECLYEAFPEGEPRPDSPFSRNWHFLNSSADLLIKNRPLSSYFRPFAPEKSDPHRDKTTRAARQAMETRTRNRRLIVTNSGLLGLAPALVQPGDAVMVLLGHGRPVVARRLKDKYGEDTPLWQLIGEAFVNGMMEWEMMDRDIMSGPKKLKQIAFI